MDESQKVEELESFVRSGANEVIKEEFERVKGTLLGDLTSEKDPGELRFIQGRLAQIIEDSTLAENLLRVLREIVKR